MNDEEQAPRIVVRDRRAFARDGSRRPDAEPRESLPPEPASPAPKPPAPDRAPPRGSPTTADSAAPAEDPRFKQLVSLLFNQAAVLLDQEGATPGNASRTEARQGLQTVIALLEWLEEKTRGQLAPADARLIAQVLYQLRMAWMDRAQPPRRPGQPPPGAPRSPRR